MGFSALHVGSVPAHQADDYLIRMRQCWIGRAKLRPFIGGWIYEHLYNYKNVIILWNQAWPLSSSFLYILAVCRIWCMYFIIVRLAEILYLNIIMLPFVSWLKNISRNIFIGVETLFETSTETTCPETWRHLVTIETVMTRHSCSYYLASLPPCEQIYLISIPKLNLWKVWW